MKLALCILDISYESEIMSYPSILYISILEITIGNWQGSLLYLEFNDAKLVKHNIDILYCRKLFNVVVKTARALKDRLGL